MTILLICLAFVAGAVLGCVLAALCFAARGFDATEEGR